MLLLCLIKPSKRHIFTAFIDIFTIWNEHDYVFLSLYTLSQPVRFSFLLKSTTFECTSACSIIAFLGLRWFYLHKIQYVSTNCSFFIGKKVERDMIKFWRLLNLQLLFFLRGHKIIIKKSHYIFFHTKWCLFNTE